MWSNTFNDFTYIGSSIMVEINNDDEFEELINKASVKARDLNFKKLVLKSLRVDVENKDSKEIENLYSLYVMSLYNDC